MSSYTGCFFPLPLGYKVKLPQSEAIMEASISGEFFGFAGRPFISTAPLFDKN